MLDCGAARRWRRLLILLEIDKLQSFAQASERIVGDLRLLVSPVEPLNRSE